LLHQPPLKPLRRPGRAAALALMLGVVLAGPAAAQGDLDSLQREIRLVRQSVAQLESAVYGAGGNQAIANIQVQLQQILEQMRDLNGSREVLDNRIRQLEERLDKLATDSDFRLQALEKRAEAAALDPAASRPGGAEPGGTGAPSVFFPDVSAAAEPSSPDDAAGAVPGGIVSGTPTPEERYTAAIDLLHSQQFGPAETAFRQFLENNPQHRLAENASYWLGETYYARKQYEQAAATFGEAYVKYPDGGKSTHNLLKLAMSLEQLQRNADACTAYNRLLDKHPGAEQRILQQAAAARQRLQCG